MLNKLVRPFKSVVKFELALDSEKIPHPHSAAMMRPKAARKKKKKRGRAREEEE